jgi:hypothetical protein
MPASGLTMNSTLAAQTNGTIGPAFPKQLPGGNIEVIYPSEFVPGADVHVIRGPADANGYRPVITSFLQPQKALADENAASLQPQTVSAPNGGVPSGPVQPGTPSVNQPISSPSNSGTTTATANPPSGGVMLHGGTNTAPTAPANGIFNPSRVSTLPGGTSGGAVISPIAGETPANVIRNELLQETKAGIASSGGSTTPSSVIGATKQQLLQEMQQTIAPSGTNSGTHQTTSTTTPTQMIQEMRQAAAPTGNNATSPTTAKTLENVVTPRTTSQTQQVVHSSTVTSTAPITLQHAPVFVPPKVLAPPPPPPPRKK